MQQNQNAPPRLTVVTVNWFSTEFIERLFRNLSAKAESPEKISYLVVDNTGGRDSDVSRLAGMGLPVKICPHDPGENASCAHASALNFAIGMIETEFALVVDPDVHVFKNNWDAFAVDQLKTNNCSAVGATYPPWQLGKYHNFPNPVFCVFRTDDFRKHNADWTAYSKNHLVTLYNFARRQILRCGILINRKRYQKYPAVRQIWTFLERIIGVCSHDTGWKMADTARKGRIRSILFEAVLPGDNVRGSQTDAFRQLAGQFELYYYRNEPILTHRYGTASPVWRTPKGRDSDFWRQCIERFQSELNETKT